MAKYSEDELREFIQRFNVSGGGEYNKGAAGVGGRLGYTQPIDDSSSLEVGVSGHYAKGKGYKDKAVDRADLQYRKRFKNDAELRTRIGVNLNEAAGKRGVDEVGIDYTIPFKKGGKVKSKQVKASRGDGCAKRGKTRGKFR